jgi:acetyl/propionyl-CoA carboxylase alpha subunit
MGGGGKGMRIVETPAELEAAIESSRNEARSSFGDDAVLVWRTAKCCEQLIAQ